MQRLLAAILLAVGGLVPTWAAEPQTAVFAGGCFWCVESDFDKVPGVLSTVSGYAGGTVEHPTYRQVTAGGTGHRESLQVTFDPDKVSYARLVEFFWHTIDPLDTAGQFCDKGFSYTTAIFTTTPEQQRIAEESLQRLNASRRFSQPVATKVIALNAFWPAEDYHQDYYHKNDLQYRYYRFACGRDARLQAVWGDQAGKLPTP